MVRPNPNPSIPDAVLFAEILPRLPLKSLMRFKCVSKPWRSTISSSKFAKLMLQLSNSEPHNHGALIHTDFSLYAVSNYASYDGKLNFDFDIVMLNDDNGFKEGSFDLIDTCNGLLCFLSDEIGLCVWNPITNQCRKIPALQPRKVLFAPSLWGFGYVSSLDDYKIVNTCFMFDVYTKKRATFTRVFSLKNGNDVWKEFETDGPLVMYYKLVGNDNFGVVLANGKCHWLVMRHAIADIVAFDLLTETFNVMKFPEHLNGNDKGEHACIGSIEENLCVASQGLEQCLEVWVMERYGEEESWTKLVKVSSLTTPTTGPINFCSLCVNGKLLMHLNGKVWVCDWSDSDPKSVWIEETHHTHHTRQYVHSLISPFMEENEVQ